MKTPQNLLFKAFSVFCISLFSANANAQSSVVLADYDNTTLNFNGFGNSEFYVVTNPSKTGIDVSNKVGMSVRGQETWSGIVIKDSVPQKLNFSLYSVLNLKVYSPIACNVSVELQDWKNSNISKKVTVPVSQVSTWQNLVFDFTGTANNTYNKILLYFDDGATAVHVFYFDDFTMVPYYVGVSAPTIKGITSSTASPKTNEAITISATITDDLAVTGATLKWGTSPTSLNNTLTMSASGNIYSATIPGQSNGTAVYYKIVATDGNSNTTTSITNNLLVSDKEGVLFADYDVVDLTFKGFYESQFYEIYNPKNGGLNTSFKVGQLTKGFNTWEGISSTQLSSKVDFSVNKIFRMKVWSHKVAPVTIRLEDFNNNTIFYQVNAAVSDTGKWVILTFDFSKALSNKYDKLLITINAGTNDMSTYYFDDIELVPDALTAVNELHSASVNVFPNPFNEVLNLQCDADKSTFMIYDLSGKEVISGQLNRGSNSISTETLATGLYVLKIQTQSEISCEKILKR